MPNGDRVVWRRRSDRNGSCPVWRTGGSYRKRWREQSGVLNLLERSIPCLEVTNEVAARAGGIMASKVAHKVAMAANAARGTAAISTPSRAAAAASAATLATGVAARATMSAMATTTTAATGLAAKATRAATRAITAARSRAAATANSAMTKP